MAKIYYHRADFDGICSAAIVSYMCNNQIELIGVDHKDEISFEHVQRHESVYIVDFSFKPALMEELLKITDYVVWIDHHKTAMEYQYSKEITGIRDINFAGCELTWKWCYPELPIPEIVTLLGRYDVWDFSCHTFEYLNSIQLGLGLDEKYNDPKNTFWHRLFTCTNNWELNRIIEKGNIILQYIKIGNASFSKEFAYPIQFEGNKALCANSATNPSTLLESQYEKAYDLFITYIFDGTKYSVSLRTHQDNDIDVSTIAKKYGGGGHRKAAGFSVKTLPNEFVQIIK